MSSRAAYSRTDIYVIDYSNDSLLFRQEMAENYAKAQRNKRDFDRKMNILNREVKINMALLKSRETEVNSSLLVSRIFCRSACVFVIYQTYTYVAFIACAC